MSINTVNISGLDTSKLVNLKHSEMIPLFERLKKGDLKAKEELVNGNLRLVLSILKRFNKEKNNIEDLFQVGVIGLIKAIDNFDLSYNLKLSTYAVPLIIGEIKRYIRDNTSLRVSRGTKDIAYKIINYQDEFLSLNNRYPTATEISKHFSLPEYKIASILDSLKDPVSIFEPIYEDGGDTIYLEDQISDNKNSKDKESLIALKKALGNIKKREREILLSRYIYGETQVEIAEKYGISQAQVSRIEKGTIKHLKKVLK